MKTFALKISTPEGDCFSGNAVKLSVRGTEGDLAIMAGHVPFVTAVVPCTCKIDLEDESVRLAQIDGGLLTVSKNTAVLLCGSFHWNN